MSAFLGNNPLQSSGLYEDEEHPWGAPPPPPASSNTTAAAASTMATSSSQGGFGGDDREDSSFTNARFGSNADAGFAEDPYVASPFARQASYSGSGADRSFGNASRGTSNLYEEDEGTSDAYEGLGAGVSRNGFSSSTGAPSSAPPPAPEKAAPPQPSSAFASKTFQSHNPSSLLPTHPSMMSPTQQTSGASQAPQLTPGYPMPQSYSTPTASYSPFARVDSLNTRKESVEEMYGVPENFLEVEVRNAMTHGRF